MIDAVGFGTDDGGAVVDEQQESGNPVEQGSAGSDETAPSEKVEHQTEDAKRESSSTIGNLPAIKDWKKASLFAFLGCLVSVAWRNIFYYALPLELGYIPIAVVAILYVALFYSSYFTEKPRVKSSRVISFLNCACLGVIFGCCLNANLRKSKESGTPIKGIAHNVAITFSVLVALWCFVFYGFTPAGKAMKGYRYDAATGSYRTTAPQTAPQVKDETTEPKADKEAAKAKEVTVPSTKTKITIPAGWQYEEKSIEERKVSGFVFYPPYASGSMDMDLLVWDVSEDLSEETLSQYGGELSTSDLSKDYVLEDNKSSLSSADDEKAEIVELGGEEYWKAEATGDRAASGSKMICMSYYHYDNKRIYQYIIRKLVESDQPLETLISDMEGIIKSAVYK